MNDYIDYPELQEQRKFYSIDSEQNIIGTILLAPEKLLEAVSLKPSSMYDPRHKMILEACLSLSNDNKPIDGIIIAEYFEERGQIEQIGGLGYLLDIAKNTASTSNINSHIRAVNDRAKERAILDAAIQMRDAMNQPDLSTDERIAEAQKSVSAALDFEEESNTISTMKDAVKDYYQHLDNVFNNGAELGLMTGLKDLDERWQGMKGGDMVVIGARPGMGKTTLATKIIASAGFNKKKSYFSSLEMPTRQLTQRMVASVGSINLGKLKDASVLGCDEESHKITSSFDRLISMDIVIDDQGGMDIADLCNRWRSHSRKNGLDLIVIDYLQLIGDRSESRRFDVVSSVSRKLKAIAKELDVPMVVLSQLSRAVEQRPDKRPNNSDLRESGQIEQDADIIMFLYRDEVYDEGTHAKGVCELITTKFRDGAIGCDYVQFVGAKNQIIDLEYAYTPPAPEQKQYKSKGF